MATQVTLAIPDELYNRAKRLARSGQRDVAEVLVDSIVLYDGKDKVIDLSEPDPALEREKMAYLAMHPMLLIKYREQHVAIYGGELVDHDTNLDALWERVDTHYPNEFVWVTTVREEPIRTVYIPSFRLITEGE